MKITVALRLQIYTMHKTYFTARVPLSVVPDGGRLVDLSALYSAVSTAA